MTLDFSTKFCFFIDGLDEYDGFHADVIEIIAALASSSNIKMCLSSRPWNVFEDAYGEDKFPSLRLQDLTSFDIEIYVRDHLEREHRFARLRMGNSGYGDLVHEIVIKARGVFLWVFLVVRSLLRGLTNCGTISDLRKRLALLPEDLDEYFQHMLDPTEKVYHQQAAQMLETCLASNSPPSLLDLLFFNDEDQEFDLHRTVKLWTHKDIEAISRTTWKRVNARCADLVVVTHEAQSCNTVGQYKVEFLDRTVRDFLETKKIQTLLKDRRGKTFDPDAYLCHAFVAEMKHRPRVDVISWKGFCCYALRAESRLNKPQISALQEFDKTKASHRQDLARNLPTALVIQFGPDEAFHQRLWLLRACVRQGLLLYVRSELDSCDPAFEVAHLDWLPGVAKTTFWSNYASKGTAADELQFWTNQLALIRLLMNRGANPNHEISGKSLWEQMLSYVKYGVIPSLESFLVGCLETLLSKGVTSATEFMVKELLQICGGQDVPRLLDLCVQYGEQYEVTPGSKRQFDSSTNDDAPHEPKKLPLS